MTRRLIAVGLAVSVITAWYTIESCRVRIDYLMGDGPQCVEPTRVSIIVPIIGVLIAALLWWSEERKRRIQIDQAAN
jgi:hypothetical protein